jgi:2-keto-3-deoxy-6-phosphogluconate aldolase
MRSLATGGVSLDNVRVFLAAGADIVGFGAAVTSSDSINGLSEVVNEYRAGVAGWASADAYPSVRHPGISRT